MFNILKSALFSIFLLINVGIYTQDTPTNQKENLNQTEFQEKFNSDVEDDENLNQFSEEEFQNPYGQFEDDSYPPILPGDQPPFSEWDAPDFDSENPL